MEIVHTNVLHSVSTGLLEAKHIDDLIRLRESVQKSTEHMAADVTNLKGVKRRARKLYMDSLKHWNQSHSIRMYVLYGTNRFMRAASNLGRPFLPFKIRVADDLDEALKIIFKEQKKDKYNFSKSDPRNTPYGIREDDRIHNYVNELQQFIGLIDWERDGVNELRQLNSSHPFSTIYESIALIKGELDELIQERDKAEEALRCTNNELEARVKERTSELEKANKELRAEIRERKKIETELKAAEQLAESGSRAKSHFLANMSHELRTRLNHIIGFPELILDKKFGELNQTQEGYLKDVEDSSKHLLSLINDILDLSKIEAGKLEIDLSNIDLPALLENSLVMVKAQAMKHSVRLSLEVKDEAESIVADERKLKQILYNLLSNAVKFTPDGGRVRVSAQRCESDDIVDLPIKNRSNGGIKITVSDTGIGLNSEDFDRIFSPFEQVDASTNRRFSGTGLGLSLTKRLVELHRGRIWAESDGEGKGSSFHFILPA